MEKRERKISGCDVGIRAASLAFALGALQSSEAFAIGQRFRSPVDQTVVALNVRSRSSFMGVGDVIFNAEHSQRRATLTSEMSPRMVASIKVSNPMTLTEKIISKACERSHVVPNDNVWVKTDVLMTHDVCGPGTIGNFYKEFGHNAKVWDTEGVVIIPDHYIFTSDPRANRNVDILREFVEKQDIKYFYDITDRGNFKMNPDYKGVCHVALAQEGHTRPGEVLFGTDSHTCNAGAFGQFATGIGNTDASFVMGTGKLLIKSPSSMQFALEGEVPDYLLAKRCVPRDDELAWGTTCVPGKYFDTKNPRWQSKDIILQIIGDIGVAGATYRSMEFAGSALRQFSMEERQTLCNMAIEAGGKNGIIPADEITTAYVDSRNAGHKPYEVFHADPNARYYTKNSYDLGSLEPVVARPHSPDNKDLAKHCRHHKIDRVYIGSCTGGKTEDFAAAARIFQNQKVGEVSIPTEETLEATISLFGQFLWNKKFCRQESKMAELYEKFSR